MATAKKSHHPTNKSNELYTEELSGPLGQIFGVRHLSPMGAIQLRTFINEVNPTAIVIEGPSDASALIEHFAHKKCRPPLAVLSFTKARPVRSILYPLAAYSPEWIALTEGLKRKALVRFMDLPASAFLATNAVSDEEDVRPESANPRSDSEAYLDDPYTAIAELSGDPEHDVWWERTFEHNNNPQAYRDAIAAFGLELRNIRRNSEKREDETILREKYMRRVLREVLAQGHQPQRVVVVCGAYHGSVLTAEEPALTDQELAALPRVDCIHTLMPYSYARLSAQSGYGAGNNAPAYYQLLFEAEQSSQPEQLGYRFLSAVAGRLRARGHIRSSAEVIEAARLAHALAAMHGSATAPTLQDLVDGAVTCLGHGDRALIEQVSEEVAIGAEIGAVPDGVARTSLQEDFYRMFKDLRLEDYLKDKKQTVRGRAKEGDAAVLDLREDRRAATPASAFRDRSVSIFLHRLGALGIGFAKLERSGSDPKLAADPVAARSRRLAAENTFKEQWTAQWTPECEIALVENALRGDTIELACSSVLKEKLHLVEDLGDGAQIALQSMLGELQDVMDAAVVRVRELTVGDGGFASVANALRKLSDLATYGSVRSLKLETLAPLIEQLFLRATLLLPDAVRCDDDSSRIHGTAISDIQWVALTADPTKNVLNIERWWAALATVTDDPFAHGYCAGTALALLLEQGQVPDELLDRRLGLRISVANNPGDVAHYFEGLASRNRMSLLHKRSLWRSLHEFVEGLSHEQFVRTAVGLRRAFGSFELGENRRVAEILGEIWGGETAAITRAVETQLSREELAVVASELEGLEDLDL